MRRLEEAARSTPRDTSVLAELARSYLDAGFTHAAQETYERITALSPGAAGAWRGLALARKRDWLETLDPGSLEGAVESLTNAVQLEPDRAADWITLSVLRVEVGDARGAAQCAARALAADSIHAGPPLAAGYVAYRAGRLAQAESLITSAIAHLEPRLATRFRDLAPLVSEADGEALAHMGSAERDAYARRFWSEADPDPTTRVNEARLEYWARVAHALLLFGDGGEPHWDMRAELVARYGSPERVAYEPAGVPLTRRPSSSEFWYRGALNGIRRVGDAESMWYPLHAQVWDYPRLGMRVLLEDRAISQDYELPPTAQGGGEPAPDAETMARNGLVATGGGRAAFATLAPGVEPLEVRGLVSAFAGETGPRLLAHVTSPGTPDRALRADCVVIDSSEREVRRASRLLGVSRCDPASLRAGDFSFDLPPGRYRVAMAVSDGDSARGVLRASRDLAPMPDNLSMSDLVLVCGPLATSPADASVRFDPNLARRIGPGEPLLVYFEVYHLRTDARGSSRFEYEYTVRPVRADTRSWLKRLLSRPGSPPVTVLAPQEGVGSTRRQYLTVPASSLPSGRCRFELIVRDRLAGTRERRALEFEREAPPELGS